MDSPIAGAARALAAGDPIGALKRVARRAVPLQAKLLGAIETGVFRRIGATVFRRMNRHGTDAPSDVRRRVPEDYTDIPSE